MAHSLCIKKLSIIFMCSFSACSASTYYKIPGLSNSIPATIGHIITEFNIQKTKATKVPAMFHNIVLHGPHGNGKTTIAFKIAEYTNSRLISLSAASLIDTYQNSGATNIKKQFEVIGKELAQCRKSIVLFVDEIDRIAPNVMDNNNKAADNTITELWQAISQYSDRPNLLTICATNRLEKLPQGFLNRHMSRRIIFIPNPNPVQRSELLQRFFSHCKAPELSIETMDPFFNDLSSNHREIFNALVPEFTILQALLYKLNKEVCESLLPLTPQKQEEISNLTIKIAQKKDYILQKTQSLPGIMSNKSARELLDDYGMLVKSYCDDVLNFFSSKVYTFTADQLKYLVQETEGLPVRSIKSFIANIHDHAKELNHGVVTDTIIKEELQSTKQQFFKAIQEEEDKKRAEEIEKLTKEVALIDAWRRINSSAHYASTSSQTISGGGSIGIVQGSTSTTTQIPANKQYPSLAELTAAAQKEDDNSLNKKIAQAITARKL